MLGNQISEKSPLPPPSNVYETKLRETLDFYRGMVLDSLSVQMGDSPGWESIRRLVLRAFGDRGLEKEIRELINSAMDGGKNGNAKGIRNNR